MLKITRRGKKGVFQIVGTVAGGRVRESAHTASEPHAEVRRARREAELLEEATWGKRRTATVSEAVILYRQKGRSGRFLTPINEHFGKWRMGDVTDRDVANFAALAYPSASPQTLDRQVYTPLIAVWNVAHDAKLCGPHEFRRPVKPERQAAIYARDGEIGTLLPVCNQRLAACVLFLTFTGARASEVCRVEEGDVDWGDRSVVLGRTKSGRPRRVALAPMLFEAMLPLRAEKSSGTPHLQNFFGFRDRWALNRALEAACAAAGLPAYTSHQLGRHAFSARLLRQGKTLKEVQEAGGWSAASFPLVAAIYGHLERSQVDAAVRSADTDLAQLVGDQRKVVGFRGQ